MLRGRSLSVRGTGIAHARAKTDRLDARTLARLLWAGELYAIWMPDEHSGAAPAPVAVRAAGPRPDAVKERGACCVDAPAGRPLPSLRHVRPSWPQLAADERGKVVAKGGEFVMVGGAHLVKARARPRF
jgi:hypothetical protein